MLIIVLEATSDENYFFGGQGSKVKPSTYAGHVFMKMMKNTIIINNY